MDKISKFNYEAYYLDLLEGNLSEEDTALLMAFLGEHPELKLDDDSLPSLEDATIALDRSFKEGLKHIDLLSETITADNVEHFMIAETEGLLSEKRVQDLHAFIGDHQHLVKAHAQYRATHLKPDLSIVYTDKNDLKRDRKIVFWPYISLAAAASITAFFFLINSPNNQVLSNGTDVARSNDTIVKGKKGKTSDDYIPAQKDNMPIAKDSDTEKTFPVSSPDNSTTESIHNDAVNSSKKIRLEVEQLNRRSAVELTVVSADEMDIQERNLAVVQTAEVRSTTDNAHQGFDDMKNPIKPVTNRLGDLINKEVDFRTAKATSKRPGGFLVKIGNFEISHKGN